MYEVKQMKYLQGAEMAFRFVNLCVNVHTHVCICAHTCCECLCTRGEKSLVVQNLSVIVLLLQSKPLWLKAISLCQFDLLDPLHFHELLSTSRWRTFPGCGKVSVFSVFYYVFWPIFGRVVHRFEWRHHHQLIGLSDIIITNTEAGSLLSLLSPSSCSLCVISEALEKTLAGFLEPFFFTHEPLTASCCPGIPLCSWSWCWQSQQE